jgi:tetratricopeptide (TPR) repeat protein
MKPTHSPKAFTAKRDFTGRRVERELLRRAVEQSQGYDDYRVLNWYGVGGQGKSALAREFLRMLEADASPAKGRPRHAKVNFDDARLRLPEEALLSIRLQLAQSFGHHFGAFDTAFARFFALTNPGTQMRQKHPELFHGENALLDDLLDASEGAISAAADVGGIFVPGLNLVYKYGARMTARVREWYERRGKEILTGLDQLSADEIAEQLPTYLGADICELLERHDEARILVILDTYEALWRDSAASDPRQSLRVDAWVRRLVQDAPGVLFVIMGREHLLWPQIDSNWSEIVESHLLGELSEEDADQFLRRVPIPSADVRQAIIDGANGLPFYLNLQVDLLERLKGEVGEPTLEDFGGSHPRVLAQFLDHLGENETRLLRLASYPIALDEPVMNHLAERFLGGIGHLNWARLSHYSFIESEPDGRILMHALMKEELQASERQERPGAYSQIHQFLFETYAPLCQATGPASITVAHEVAFEAAIHHLAEAQPEHWIDFLNAGKALFEAGHRARFLERIYSQALNRRRQQRSCDDESVLALRHELASKIGYQGRYREAENEFRAIWEVQSRHDVLGEEHHSTLITRHNLAHQMGNQGRYGEAEAEYRSILQIKLRPHVCGEEHPSTLTTRQNLAFIIGSLGRYREAENEFRSVWEVQRRPDVLGEEDPSTLITRHNLALQASYQGRYGEAEAEFRTIWEILRRPDVLGEEHPTTLTTRHDLALQFVNQGQYRKAEHEFRAIWEIQRRPDMLGEENPTTLTARHNLANQIGYQGRHCEAEAELDTLLTILRQPNVFGETHPSTLIVRHNRAQQIGSQGRYREAALEFHSIWEIQRRPDVLGEEHPTTLTTRHSLAMIIGMQGRHREAEGEYRSIYEIQRRPEVLGEEHPATLNARHNLAHQVGSQGRFGEAEDEFRAIFEIQRRPDVLGEKHPSTLTTRHNLASQIGYQGRHREAETEFRATWEIQRQPNVLGEAHHYTLTTRHELAQQIAKQGRYQEAEQEYRAIWQIQCRPEVSGEKNRNHLRTRYFLARMLDGQGRYSDADELLRELYSEMEHKLADTHRWRLELANYLAERARTR